MRDAYLEELLPRLKQSAYEITSPRSDAQNCIGHALQANLYFDPGVVGTFIEGRYWPPDIRADDSVEAWVQLFEMHQFRECANGDLQTGMEKIAIYVGEDGNTSHCARQLPSGQWTSKLNKLEDIRRDSLADLLSPPEYAAVVKFMSRPLKDDR